jgi:predicted aspartyl protease
MVDTGAAYSWIHRSRLEPLGVPVVRKLEFQLMNGKVVEREVAAVFLATDGFTGGDNVVLAEPGDFEVIGSHTLESLALTADPVRKVLVPLKAALALNACVSRRVE